MKTTVPKLRRVLREELKRRFLKEDVDSERRRKHGYEETDSGAGVEYGDLPEALEFEDVDRLRRAADGYGESEFEENLEEEPGMSGLGGSVGRKSQDFQKTLEPRSPVEKGSALAHTVMSGLNDPAVYRAFAAVLKRDFKDHPLAQKIPSSLAPMSPPKQAPPAAESKDQDSDDDGKKKDKKDVKAKSHAAPRGEDGDIGGLAGEGFDAVSGRDPKETEPEDKKLRLPIYNMSDEEDETIPLGSEVDDDFKMPRLSSVVEKKKSMKLEMDQDTAKSQGLEPVFPVGHQLADRIFYDTREGQYYDSGTDLYLWDYDPITHNKKPQQ